MVFDMRDFGVLSLCGICRYLPIRLRRKFDVDMFSVNVINTLRKHGLIKLQSDFSGYKLTYDGRQVLAEMGYTFPEGAKTDIKRNAYKRKLKVALWNIALHLAGIDIWGDNVYHLGSKDVGYVSSLMMRSDDNKKVLAATRFLGVLRIYDVAYIPYFLQDENEKIQPAHERSTYTALVDSINGVREIKLILAGNSLEELWNNLNAPYQGKPSTSGRKCFDVALEELGSDYLLVPLNHHGSLQMNVMKLRSYRERLAKAVGCSTEKPSPLNECDGMLNGEPCIIAVDFDVKRILRAIKQIQRYDGKITSLICCFPFQKTVMRDFTLKYGIKNVKVRAINENSLRSAFPEMNIDFSPLKPYTNKEGLTIDASDGKISKKDIELLEDCEDISED